MIVLGSLFLFVWVYMYFFDGEAQKGGFFLVFPRLLFSLGLIYGGYIYLKPDYSFWYPPYFWESEDFQEYISQAREELPYFLECLDDPDNKAYMMFEFETDSQHLEHVWALVHSHKDNFFTVSIESELISHEGGVEDLYTIETGDIEDWHMFEANDDISGGFTLVGFEIYVFENKRELNNRIKMKLNK